VTSGVACVARWEHFSCVKRAMAHFALGIIRERETRSTKKDSKLHTYK